MRSSIKRLSGSSSQGVLILAAAVCVSAPAEACAKEVETPAATATPSRSTHQVKAGETLSGIAAAYRLDWRDLARANQISDARKLSIGRVLIIARDLSPADRSHRVRRGETLSGIARRYGVAWRDLAALNGLVDPDRLATGTTLFVDYSAGRVPPPRHTAEARDRFALKYGGTRPRASSRTTPVPLSASLVQRLVGPPPSTREEKATMDVTAPAVMLRPETVALVLVETEQSKSVAASPGRDAAEVSPAPWEARAQADFAAQISAFAARYEVHRAPFRGDLN